MFHTKITMNKHRNTTLFIVILLIVFSISTLVPLVAGHAEASHRTLSWSVVNTPSSGPTNVIVNPCEISAIALSPDSRTFYCVDTADNRTYKSIDSGYTWLDISNRLTAAKASQRLWDIAIAPDDGSFIVAVTDTDNVSQPGPGKLFFSIDGGANWQNILFNHLAPDEYISCLDISLNYGSPGTVRDIAVGTRTITGQGRVFTCQYSTSSSSNWDPIPSLTDSVNTVKFSPNYNTDYTIASLSNNSVNSRLNLGLHNTTNNTTNWNVPGVYDSYPINIRNNIIVSRWNDVIRANLELPGDFVGTNLVQRSCFASILTDNSSLVVYLNANVSPQDINITPRLTGGGRISTIAYNGSQATGILLAGEVSAVPELAMAKVWQCSNPQTVTPGGASWLPSYSGKLPTGGGTTGWANTILKWSEDGQTAYCGTSSENATVGGTAWATGQWPYAKTQGATLDESAFSRSINNGTTWNQTGLIDTFITRLSDSAALELPEGAESTDQTNILYLASLNENTTLVTDNKTFDSVWRSITSPPGDMWERILTRPTSDEGTILRINPRGDSVSHTVVFADLYTDNVTYSENMGDSWGEIYADVKIRDMCLASDSTLYLLDEYFMRRLTRNGSAWTNGNIISTGMDVPAHTICAPLKNGTAKEGHIEEIAIVGSGGVDDSYVSWIDLAKFNPQFEVLKQLPDRGDVHVVADSQFDVNKMIYAAQNLSQDPNAPSKGVIYRWKLGTSTGWDNLEPLNKAFFGIETLNDVLYGAWYFDSAAGMNGSGADRTLYATVRVPPPPEWDDLTTGLPAGPSLATLVAFTREPASLHISSNQFNTLWAIDDKQYAFNTRTGCLWSYVDSAAGVGPWPTSPPTGSFIGTDPVTGRSQQIDYKWRQLQDMKGYDLLIAKDVDFTLPLSQNLNFMAMDNGTLIRSVDNYTGAWIIEPADVQSPAAWMAPGLLESGRSYYWKVRGSRAISGEIVHSPWSPAMFFTVKPGFIVNSQYPGPTLISPVKRACTDCKQPVSFTWTPIKMATKYEFILASDAGLSNIVTKAYCTTTAYEYKDKLDYGKPYYWQVKAVAPVPSDPSPVAVFSLSGNAAGEVSPVTQAVRSIAPGVPMETLIWVIIALAYLLILLIIIYAFVSRRN